MRPADGIGDDLLLVLIAFVPLSPTPIPVALAIIFLHVSLWSVYEIGYYENDLVAAKHERDGKLSSTFKETGGRFSILTAWIWAAALGVAGVACVWQSEVSHLADGNLPEILASLVLWAAVLVFLRKLFQYYNHIDKMTRVFVYLPLQLVKYGFPALFFDLPAAGAALIFAQIIRRWAPYLVYRYMKKEPLELPSRLVRLLMFALLWLLLMASQASLAFFLHGLFILVWLGLRAARQLQSLLQNAGHVTVDKWKEAGPSGDGPTLNRSD
ncbi:MAG: hypothetical protein EAZ40_04550 [Rhodobacterales bacterium]|nr:MAG: hypothetical protein EAZ40_04550 [Rhodobacterales bacterium]